MNQNIRNVPPAENILEKVYDLQRQIFYDPNETSNALEALQRAYEQLNDQQKIAFILAGGTEQLICFQQRRREEASFGTGTDSLPVIC